MPVWRGKAASQELKDRAGNAIPADNKGNTFWLDGGHEQIVVNPKLLNPEYAGKREFTGWGYDDSDIEEEKQRFKEKEAANAEAKKAGADLKRLETEQTALIALKKTNPNKANPIHDIELNKEIEMAKKSHGCL